MARKKKKDGDEIVLSLPPILPKAKKPPLPEKPISLNVVPVSVFCQLCGEKADQLGGFKLWAKKNSLGIMSVQAWRKALVDYRNRPV